MVIDSQLFTNCIHSSAHCLKAVGWARVKLLVSCQPHCKRTDSYFPMNFNRRSPYRFFGILFGILLLLLLTIGFFFNWANLWILYLLAVNVVIIIAYGYDKQIAASSRMRVPEKILHLLALVGGSPGAFGAQQVFRHKTRKPSFQLTFWVIVAVQAVAIVLWMR